MSRGEKSLLLGNKSDDNGNEKFWNTFYRLCVQFQQNENQPLVTWSSSVFGLYGVITKVFRYLYVKLWLRKIALLYEIENCVK